MQYEHESGVLARWHGGAYIELGYVADKRTGPFNDKGQASYEKGDFIAHEVINVWDYAEDVPTIERSPAALAETVDRWISGEEDEDE